MPARSPYDTALALGADPPTHISEDAVDDRNRVQAYDTYEDIFHNHPGIFSLVLKTSVGEEVYRRLIPSARSIVEATNRYLAVGLTWAGVAAAPTSAADPAAGAGGASVSDEAVGTVLGALSVLFQREAFGSKFMALKRWMLVRGDAMLHVTADPSKDEGTRIKITELLPGTYFAIEDPADAERVIGCYVINLIADDEGEEIAARLEYRKVVDEETAALANGAPLGSIFMKLSFWETDGWDDRAGEPGTAVAAPARFGAERFVPLLEGQALPSDIKAIPVYHFRNNPRGGQIFGTSELQGIETIIAGISQVASDEDVAVALQGLGVYWTDSGRPKDDQGNDVSWSIAPASMIELQQERKIGRLDGISSVQPSLDHLKMLKNEARETTGTSAVATGVVDVAVAQSGVALAIQMQPTLAKNAEKEQEIGDKLDQLVFDLLNGWMPAYEGFNAQGVTVTSEFGDALPVDRAAIIAEVVALVNAKVVSAEFGRTVLNDKLGYNFPPGMMDEIAAEASALLDATGARLDDALAAPATALGAGTADTGTAQGDGLGLGL